MTHRHSKKRRFMLSTRTGKIVVHAAPSASLSRKERDSDFNFDTMLAALIEVEAIISPALDKKTTPPSLAVMFLGEAICLRLTGKEELTSPKLRAMFCQFVLVAWSSGQFAPSSAFPYTYDEVVADFNTPLEEKEDTLSTEEINAARDLAMSLSHDTHSLPEHLREIDRVVRGLMVRGLRALSQKQYEQAAQVFFLAEQLDIWDASQARYFRAMALARQRKIAEAYTLFTQDAEQRSGDAPLSWLFSEWCAICIAPSRSAYFASFGDGEEQLLFKEELFDEEYSNYEDNALHPLVAVFFTFLEGEENESLTWLEDWKPDVLDIPFWVVPFWKAMVLANGNDLEAAQAELQQAVLAQIPPMFLLPLRWFAHSHADFYERVVQPLLTEFDLWPLVATSDALARDAQRFQEQEQVEYFEQEFPGFSQVYAALEDIRERSRSGATSSTVIRCHYLDEPSGEDLIQAYVELMMQQVIEDDRTLPVFVAEIPPILSAHPPAAYLMNELLDQLYDPLAYTRVSMDKKWERLVQQLREWEVELIILTGIENLTTPAGKKLLLKEIEWLRHLCVSDLSNIPVLLVSNRSMIERLRTESADWGRLLTALMPESAV